MTSATRADSPSVEAVKRLDAIERRARRIAGANHSHGAIPARCWRQAIAEAFLGERIRDPQWADALAKSLSRDTL